MKVIYAIFSIFTVFLLFAEETEMTNKEPPTFSWADSSRFYAGIDYLYWTVYEGALDFVYTDVVPIGNTYGGGGDIERTTFDWHSGFRVFLGYCFQPDYWSFTAQYGNYVPNGSKNISVQAGQTLIPTFPNLVSTSLSKAESRISLRCHFGDLMLSKALAVSKKLQANLVSGLSGIWFKQNWEIKYEGSQPGGNRETVKPKWRFKGVGIKTGVDLDWDIIWGLSWFASTNFSTIFGNYDNRSILFTTNLSTNDQLIFQNTHYDDFRIVPVIDLSMGPSWKYMGRFWGMKLGVLYEISSYFNVQQVDRDDFSIPTLSPQSRVVDGLLSMQGLTANLTLSF